MIYRKEDIKADLDKVLMKYAKQDVNHAKKKGGLIITDTKHGNIDVKSDGKVFTVTTVGMSGKELFKGNDKETMEFLAKSYKVEDKKMKSKIRCEGKEVVKTDIKKVITAIYKKFPNDMKFKKGGKLTVLIDVPNLVKALGGKDGNIVLNDLTGKEVYSLAKAIGLLKNEASFEDKVKAIMKSGKSRESAEKIAGAMVRDMKGQGKESTQVKEAGEEDKDMDAKVKGMAKLLKELGMDAASKDVTKDNLNIYAQWALNDVKRRINLTDPVTRKKTVNKKAEALYKAMVASFKKLGLSANESKKLDHDKHIEEMKSIAENTKFPKKESKGK